MRKTALTAALLMSGGLALAHSGATGIVKERMDGMNVLARSMKSLAGMAKSGDIDPVQVKESAVAIQAHSGQALYRLFPEGSLQPVSEAKLTIWQDWNRFAAISDALFETAGRLEREAASPDLDLGLYVKELGNSCSTCHQDFRIKK